MEILDLKAFETHSVLSKLEGWKKQFAFIIKLIYIGAVNFRYMDRLEPGSYVRPCNKNNIYMPDAVQCISNGYSGEKNHILSFILLLEFQICKFKVGSFNYPMNKITFDSEVNCQLTLPIF